MSFWGALNEFGLYFFWAALLSVANFYGNWFLVLHANSEAAKRLDAGNTEKQDWVFHSILAVAWIFVFWVFVGSKTIYGAAAAFKMVVTYGLFSVVYMPYYFWRVSKIDDIWLLRKRPESNATGSNILKFKDILNNSEIWKVLKITKGYGEPLVCYGQHSEEEESSEARAWLEGTEKVRVSCEDRGLVVGAPGSGKTTYLIAQLIDWMASGKSFVATDIKPEIWSVLKENGVFEKYGYSDWVINPTDVRSHHYNIFSEAQSSAELNEILAVVIPSGETSAEVFAENARRLLKAVILELGEAASLPACQRYINSCDDIPELLKQLRQSESEAVVAIAKDISRTAKNENLLSSVMTSLSKAFVFLDDDRIRATTARSDLALKDVLLKPKQAVFLQFEQEYKTTTATLFGAMVAHTLRILQSNYRRREEVFVALDEIINCAPIPKFIDSLNTMRSAKMPTFLYLQALEGLNRVYGQGADRLFMGACDFKAVYKIGDIETARTFSDLIGVTEATVTSYSSGSSSGSGITNDRGLRGNDGVTNSSGSSSSKTVATQIMQVIEPDEFIRLQPQTAVCIYRGEASIFSMPTYFRDFSEVTQWPQWPQCATMGEALDAEEVLRERATA